MLMNSSRVPRAREWIAESLSFSHNAEVSSFDTASRILGGLLSAHYLSTEIPQITAMVGDDASESEEDLYIEKATDLADRLFGAFDSPSKVPYPQVHLGTRIGSIVDNDIGTTVIGPSGMQLEFRYIATLLGEKLFWDATKDNALSLNAQTDSQALISGTAEPTTRFSRDSHGGLGVLTVSYYGKKISCLPNFEIDSSLESLLKQYLQTSRQESTYWSLWIKAISSIRDSFTAFSQSLHLVALGEIIPGDSVVAMEEVTCKIPGLIALGVTGGHTLIEAKKGRGWGREREDDIAFAKELMNTCWTLYKSSPSGLAAARSFIKITSDPSPDSSGMYPSRQADRKALSNLSAEWEADISLSQEQAQNDQDSTFAESLFYFWRITGDEMYREMGWQLFSSYINHTSTAPRDGFVSLSSVLDPSKQKDIMNSFWLSRTLKFFYLLFAPVDLLPLDKVVFTTSGHVFPRVKVPRNFKTGSWKQQDKSRTELTAEPSEGGAELPS